MKHTLIPAAAIVLACAAIGHAHHVDRQWQGETRNGSSIILDLTVKGATVTDDDPQRREHPAVRRADIEGHFHIQSHDQRSNRGVFGELTGDEVKVWLDRQGVSSAIVLKRVKD